MYGTTTFRMIVLIASLSTTLVWGIIATAAEMSLDELGRTVKLRILVDKVMQPEEGWITKEWIVKETAKAGFNVYSPRRGHDRLDEVLKVTEWCQAYGIYHMPWMRGTLSAPPGPEADGKRLVLPSGKEQPLWSPNADELWAWITKYVLEYAKISAQHPSLIGVFLDYENYAPGREGNCFSLSYDNLILTKFATARGIELPPMAPPQRKSWLEEKGLHPAFAEFQISHWRERCRTLRQAVDHFNAKFQFCIYPAPGTPFIVQACYREWSSTAAPIIMADPHSYGRRPPDNPGPQKEALLVNRQILIRNMTIAKEARIPFIYSGGIDPIARGADPEFCAKNAVMISEITGGYWVFYDGPKYKGDHQEYFKWFTWANRAISDGQLQAWQEPRKTPE